MTSRNSWDKHRYRQQFVAPIHPQNSPFKELVRSWQQDLASPQAGTPELDWEGVSSKIDLLRVIGARAHDLEVCLRFPILIATFCNFSMEIVEISHLEGFHLQKLQRKGRDARPPGGALNLRPRQGGDGCGRLGAVEECGGRGFPGQITLVD